MKNVEASILISARTSVVACSDEGNRTWTTPTSSMLIAGDLARISCQVIQVRLLRVPSGVETWVRQSQEFLVTSPHEVHERLLSWGDDSASGAPVLSECDVEIDAVDQNEPRVQRDHLGQLVLSESLCPRQTDVDLLHLLCA
jgi:hypothetical protein